MKFRPLCIDHHLRAQEFLLAKRDAEIRKAALLTLPQRTSLYRRRRRGDGTINNANNYLDFPRSKIHGSKTDGNSSGEEFGQDIESDRQSNKEELSSSNDGRSPLPGADSLSASDDENSSEQIFLNEVCIIITQRLKLNDAVCIFPSFSF